MILLAAFGFHRDAVAGLVDLDDFLASIETDAIRFAAGFEQDLVQIGAMDERVGIFELLAERFAERDPRDLLAGDRIHHDQIVWKHRECTDRLDQSEQFEHPEHVRTKLDAGADLLKLDGLLDDPRRDPLARQRERGGEPANAAADDQDFAISPIVHTFVPSGRILEGVFPPPAKRGRGTTRSTVWRGLVCAVRVTPAPTGRASLATSFLKKI